MIADASSTSVSLTGKKKKKNADLIASVALKRGFFINDSPIPHQRLMSAPLNRKKKPCWTNYLRFINTFTTYPRMLNQEKSRL